VDEIRFAVDRVRGQVTEEDGVAVIIWDTIYMPEGGELKNRITLEGFTASQDGHDFKVSNGQLDLNNLVTRNPAPDDIA